jgi:dipeptidase D
MSKIDRILKFFEGINTIPRKSENREPITRYLTEWAEGEGFSVRRDGWDNLVMTVPASKGYEKAPIVILQGHSDMVCEKTPESDHDFTKDAVKCIIEGEWMRGDNTSLGADNGIALALAMDIATDPEAVHPPLEILVTSDEEVGLIGANKLEKGFLKGRILLNLDSEDEGIFTIGCAGGADSKIALPIDKEAVPSGGVFRKLTIGGLLGGHSGMDIHLNRGNALKMAGRILSEIAEKYQMRLVSLSGGSGAPNAICRDAQAVFAVPASDAAACASLVEEWAAFLKNEIKSTEPDLRISLEEAGTASSCLKDSSCRTLLRLIRVIPHGIDKMSSDIKDLVETSSNLAWMEIQEKEARILASQRSSVMSELAEINQAMVDAALLAGGSCETVNKYPSWEPNIDSPLLQRCKKVYQDLMDKEPVIEAIHAGLECGVIGDKYPGMDMISIGPTLIHPHTPEERLYLPSLEPFRDFLVALLKTFKD